MKPALEHQWLHIQIFEGEVYVFIDDGHWKDTTDPVCREDWDKGIAFDVDDLADECYLGSTDGHGTFRTRIRLNPPPVKYGKFGMPYTEE
jgi:hypothetical protein